MVIVTIMARVMRILAMKMMKVILMLVMMMVKMKMMVMMMVKIEMMVMRMVRRKMMVKMMVRKKMMVMVMVKRKMMVVDVRLNNIITGYKLYLLISFKQFSFLKYCPHTSPASLKLRCVHFCEGYIFRILTFYSFLFIEFTLYFS